MESESQGRFQLYRKPGTLEGLKRKFPRLDVEGALSRLQVEKTYVTEPVGAPVYLHGDDSGRSVVKSAFILAIHAGVMPEHCERAREYLKGKPDSACWWFYYDRDLIANCPTGEIFHCLAVKGNPNTRQLVGYVELFRAYRILVLLSDRYDGKDFTESYAVDPTTGEELSINPDLDLPAGDVISVCSGAGDAREQMVAAVDELMAIAYPRKVTRERERAVKEALLTAVTKLNLAADEAIGPEHVPDLTRFFMEEFRGYLLHQMRALRPRRK